MTFADAGDYKSAYETLIKFISAPSDLDWVKEYNNLFPTQTQVMDTGTMIDYGPRQSLTHVTARMKTFLKSWPTRFKDLKTAPADRPALVMRATKAYIEQKEEDGWKFIKKSSKFIYDNNGSELANWIRKTEGMAETGGQQKRTSVW